MASAMGTGMGEVQKVLIAYCIETSRKYIIVINPVGRSLLEIYYTAPRKFIGP
jgi:hypothetical protein